jgi:SUKH-4 immunity protein
MDYKQFISEWENLNDDFLFKLQPVSIQTLSVLNCSASDAEFLSKCGLPESAAPFLAFEGDRIKWENEYFGIAKLIEKYPFLDENYEHYIYIGHDGCGDPIVINLKNNAVEALNHDNDFEPRFMNSSVFQLAQFLLFYRIFVREMHIENGDKAYLNTNFSDKIFQKLSHSFKTTDPEAAIRGFWYDDISSLILERNENSHKQ